MPELPEVETIVRELQECLPGKQLTVIEEFYPGTVRVSSKLPSINLNHCVFYGIIEEVFRRGKYIYLVFSSGYAIVIHLRMTGKLVILSRASSIKDNIVNNQNNDHSYDLKHIRATFIFSDDTSLIFNDPRTFGKIDLIPFCDLELLFDKLGYEPLSSEFNSDYLGEAFLERRISLKKSLLNQNIVAGIGNIYANEILYRCKLLPSRIVSNLLEEELINLVTAIKTTLAEAIDCNGTSISDYRRVDDKQGTFQNFLQVYGKKSCPLGHSLSVDKFDGRSTYYCPVCQK